MRTGDVESSRGAEVLPLLVLRADGGPNVGSGHLVRLLGLAQAWLDARGAALLLTNLRTADWPASAVAAEIPVVQVPGSHPDPRDLASAIEAVRWCPGAWLACDGYHFDAAYARAARRAGARVLFMDDLGDAPEYEADVLVNQNIFAERLRYVCQPGARLLLGTRYALLRREFGRWREWRRQIPDRARRILVTMGGGRTERHLIRVLRALQRLASNHLDIRVLGGAPGIDPALDAEVRAMADSCGASHEVAGVSSLMAWADVAVSAGGSTCWELCYMGVPTALLTVAPNQAGLASGLGEAGAAWHLGEIASVDEPAIAAALETLVGDRSLREALSARARSLVDGLGASRVVSVLQTERVHAPIGHV